MSEQLYAQVVFNLPLDRSYTYSVPDRLREYVRPGVRVAVQLRRHLSTGYVVGTTSQAPDVKIKPIRDILDSDPLFDDNLLELTRWIADYYLCSWGQALDCALPPGVRLAAKSQIAPAPLSDADMDEALSSLSGSAPRQHEILKALLEKRQMTLAQIQRSIGVDSLYSSIASLEKRGLIVREAVITAGARPKRLSAVRVAAGVDVEASISELGSSSPKQAVALKMLAERGEMSAAELTRATECSYDSIHRLVKKELVERFEKEVFHGDLDE